MTILEYFLGSIFNIYLFSFAHLSMVRMSEWWDLDNQISPDGDE